MEKNKLSLKELLEWREEDLEALEVAVWSAKQMIKELKALIRKEEKNV